MALRKMFTWLRLFRSASSTRRICLVRPQVESLLPRELMAAGLGEHVVPPTAGIGMYDPKSATWYLRQEASSGTPDKGSFTFGGADWKPILGDWNGDGTMTVGTVDPSSGMWYLRNENSAGTPDAATPFEFGAPGWIPVVGDWTGTGHTGIGVVDPSTNTWYLRDTVSSGVADHVFQFGLGGWTPVVGDWTHSGHSDVGVVDPHAGDGQAHWYLRNTDKEGTATVSQQIYGLGSWKPVTGQWSGSGSTELGMVDEQGKWYLANSGTSPQTFVYGIGQWTPLGLAPELSLRVLRTDPGDTSTSTSNAPVQVAPSLEGNASVDVTTADNSQSGQGNDTSSPETTTDSQPNGPDTTASDNTMENGNSQQVESDTTAQQNNQVAGNSSSNTTDTNSQPNEPDVTTSDNAMANGNSQQQASDTTAQQNDQQNLVDSLVLLSLLRPQQSPVQSTWLASSTPQYQDPSFGLGGQYQTSGLVGSGGSGFGSSLRDSNMDYYNTHLADNLGGVGEQNLDSYYNSSAESEIGGQDSLDGSYSANSYIWD